MDNEAGMYVIWQVQGDFPMTWIDYDVKFMHRLEDHQNIFVQNKEKKYEPLRHAPMNNAEFVYDQLQMIQTNTRSNMQRRMRRCLMHCSLYERERNEYALIAQHNQEHHQPRKDLPATQPRAKGTWKGSSW